MLCAKPLKGRMPVVAGAPTVLATATMTEVAVLAREGTATVFSLP